MSTEMKSAIYQKKAKRRRQNKRRIKIVKGKKRPEAVKEEQEKPATKKPRTQKKI
jgi:hypothetical protein